MNAAQLQKSSTPDFPSTEEDVKRVVSMSTSQDDELNMLREQRRAALQQQLEAQASQQADAEVQQQQAQMEAAQLDGAMRNLLSNDARSRLATLSLATPARAASIKNSILQLHQQGKFTAPMSDEELKQLLSTQSKSRRSASIRRI
jgi:DNA-binding TFAR19-related protein (PDSD5 family)